MPYSKFNIRKPVTGLKPVFNLIKPVNTLGIIVKPKTWEPTVFEKIDYKTLVNCTDDLLWSVNINFKLIAANKAFIQNLEDSASVKIKPGDDLLIPGIFPKDYLAFWVKCYDKALGGESFTEEIYSPAFHKRKESWTETSFNPIYKDDIVVGIACCSGNITDKKLAEEELRKSEARLITAQAVAKVGSWETDLLTLKVIWSEETYRIFEIDPTNYQTSHPGFLAFVHPDDRAKVDAAFVISLDKHSINTIEHRILTTSGLTKFVEERWQIFRDNKGKPTRAVGTCQDITRRKKAEYKLIESESQYRSLIEQSTDTICIIDTSLNFIEVNTSGCELFGYSKEEILQLHLVDILFEEDLKTNKLKLDELKSGKTLSNERRIKRKDGSALEVELSGKMLKDGRIIIFGRDITQRKKTEYKIITTSRQLQLALTEQVFSHKRIEESEKQYRQIVETAQEGIWLIDENNYTILVNKKMAAILEYSVEEMMGKQNYCFMDDEWKKKASRNIIDRKLGMNENHDFKYITKSGKDVWTNISTNPVFNDDGIYKGALAMVTDITERKEGELLLRESNERYNLISKATNDMVWDWDLVTNKVYRNKEGWKKIFRTGDIETKNETTLDWDNRVHPEDLEKVMKVNDEIHNTVKDFFEVECRVRRDDGTYAHIHDRGNIIRNDQGKAVRLIGASQDITARKEAEQQVAKSESRFRSLVQNSSDLIGILDEKGYYLYSSPAIKKVLGYEPESLLGKNAFAFIHPDDIISIKTHLANKNTEIYNREISFRFKNVQGEWRWLESKITDLSDNPEIKGYVFNSRDITERKIAEGELIATSEELEHSLAEQVLSRKKTEESEARLKESQAISHLGHWELNFTTHIALWSDEACRIYGLSPDDNMHPYSTWLSYIHPEDLDYVIKMIDESQKTLSSSDLNHRIVLKDGTVKYITSKSKFKFDENGKLVGIYGITLDVTESKIAEDEIKKLSIIARETVNAVIISDPEGRIIWVNEAFTQITEFESEEVLGKKPGDFLQGKETDLDIVRTLNLKLKNVQPYECDLINYSKSGRKYWIRLQSQPQFDEAGKLKYFFSIETDITKEKEAEQILKASEERYRYLFNNNPSSIIIWDLDNFQILEVNETAAKLYGYSREEFLKKTTLELRNTEDYEKVKQFAADAKENPDFKSENIWKHINSLGEEIFMNISSHRILFNDQPVMLSLATNITEKVFLERELEKERLIKQHEITEAVISAQEQERQELGSELHDNITQILAGSRLYLGLVKTELKEEHPYLIETDNLIKSAIDELRNLSHSLIPPSLNESELLEALHHIIEITQLASGIQISLDAPDFKETLTSDKLKLTIYRIVQEQLHNITKYASASKVNIRLVQHKEKIVLSIKDDGVGFDTEIKAKGVGLMNIKTRAALFNGEMRIISTPGNGCELSVCFN